MKLNKLASALALGAGLMSAAGHAAAIDYSTWRFQDDSIDFIMRPDTAGDLGLVTSGTITAGDVFVSVFEIATATSTPSSGGSASNLIPAGKELTGVSVVQLLTKNADVNGDGAGDGIWAFTPYSGGMNSILALGTSGATVVGGGAGGGAMAAMWLNDTNNAGGDRDLDLDAASNPATNCTSLGDCLTQASLDTVFQVDGFWGTDPTDRGDADNFWTAQPLLNGDNIDIIKVSAETDNFGIINFALSNLFNAVEPVFFQTKVGVAGPCASGTTYSAVADNCVQIKGSANILGGAGLTNGAIAHDDLDARKLVPEPASLALLGLGLLGMVALRRQAK